MSVASDSIALPSDRVHTPKTGWGLAFRLARRELRSGLAGFRVFVACLVLGVTAIAAVGSVASALVQGLAEEGQTILGGDVDVRLIHREATPEEFAAFADGTSVSQTAEVRAMARTADRSEQSLIELKAVDGAYPLYGEMALAPVGEPSEGFAAANGRPGALADASLLRRLGLKVGDPIQVGDGLFTVNGTIEREPDRVAGGFQVGPRVMIARSDLEKTGLVRPGSLITYHYRIRMAEGARDAASIKAFTDGLKERFPEAGWRIQDRSNSAPGVRSFVLRVALFLSLVGLTALIVGGVGVANSVKSYLDGKRTVIATLKCLGAPGALIFRVYLIQVMALAGLGIAIGLALGAATPYLVGAFAAAMIPIPVVFGVYPGALLLAAAYGFLTALAFAIWPLARAREVPATGLFRDIVAPVRRWPRPGYAALASGALIALAALAIFFADEPLFAFWFLLGAAGVFLILRGAGYAIMGLAVRAPQFRSPGWRLAVANLHRPGAATPSVVLSLGLGVTLLTSISLIDGNLSDEIRGDLADKAPSFFFLDIQPSEAARFEAEVTGAEGVDAFNRVPMLRGRITEIDGVRAADAQVAPEAAWALRGDRGLTYSATPPENSALVRGEWWPEDYSGPQLVSLDEDIARGFGLEIGDTLAVNVLGRDLAATVANTRRIDWTSLGINFVMVFSPGLISSAPHTELATVGFAPGEGEAREEALEREVAQGFPAVTIIRVKDALDAVNRMLGDFAMAVRATSVLTVIAGVLVLAGAMLAGFQARRREAVLLKVLGATRGHVLGIYLREYALLGFATAVIAAAAGTLAAYIVVVEVMQLPWRFLPGTLALTVIGATLITILLGLAGTWRALTAPAARILRNS